MSTKFQVHVILILCRPVVQAQQHGPVSVRQSLPILPVFIRMQQPFKAGLMLMGPLTRENRRNVVVHVDIVVVVVDGLDDLFIDDQVLFVRGFEQDLQEAGLIHEHGNPYDHCEHEKPLNDASFSPKFDEFNPFGLFDRRGALRGDERRLLPQSGPRNRVLKDVLPPAAEQQRPFRDHLGAGQVQGQGRGEEEGLQEEVGQQGHDREQAKLLDGVVQNADEVAHGQNGDFGEEILGDVPTLATQT